MPDADPEDIDLLHRLRARDPTAPAECCERFLPLLLNDRRWVRADVRDEHLIEDAVDTALVNFVKTPERYDPARLPLLGYLRMAAHGDLLNLLKREQRHREHRAPLTAVDLSPSARNDEDDGPDLPGEISREELERRLREKLPDERDRQAAAMMVDGVRDTRDYACLYGFAHLPFAEQQRQVRTRKNRLDKVMKRLGMRMRGDD